MEINLFGKEVKLSKALTILAIPVVLVLLGVAGFIISRSDGAVVFKQEEEKKVEAPKEIEGKAKENTATTPAVKIEDEIKVYVVGCVNNPGIVTLKKGQMIDDAIKLAGGVTEEADVSNINLVYKLKENVTLRILPKQEKQVAQAPQVVSAQQASNPAPPAPVVEFIAETGSGVVIDNGSNGTTGSSGQQKSGGKININSASAEQLDSLPGIGIETAKDIIAFREKNGDFKTINDIMKVTGIKESKFSKIKDQITVD